MNIKKELSKRILYILPFIINLIFVLVALLINFYDILTFVASILGCYVISLMLFFPFICIYYAFLLFIDKVVRFYKNIPKIVFILLLIDSLLIITFAILLMIFIDYNFSIIFLILLIVSLIILSISANRIYIRNITDKK